MSGVCLESGTADSHTRLKSQFYANLPLCFITAHCYYDDDRLTQHSLAYLLLYNLNRDSGFYRLVLLNAFHVSHYCLFQTHCKSMCSGHSISRTGIAITCVV